ncbi:MAG TPA: FliH/SctL family protein [Tepidisphaeraceae bacterium]|jgi:flagellar assembly protein FliH|nr:FliH/SctL family protein [Tepidisphaeraceae bacterium]
MGLIKSTDAPLSVAAFSMQDIEAAARNIVLRAQRQAAQILAASQTEAQKIKDEARTAGLAEGRRLGNAHGLEEGKKSGHAQALAEHGAAMTKLIAALTEIVRQLDDSRDHLHSQVIGEVVDLACRISRRVTKRQGTLDPQIMCANVREALALAVHAADVRIAVNPSQLKTLEGELPNLRLAWPHLKHVDLVADPAIGAGGARVFTAHGQIDGDLDAQLDRLVTEVLPDRRAEVT